MKRLFILISMVCISLTAMSQKAKVVSALSFIDQGILDKAKESVDQAMVHEKTKDWFNTYYAKGMLCKASFESDNPGFREFYPDPLEAAYEAFEKSIELDPKGTIKKKIITNLVYNSLAVNYYSQGSARFEREDFMGALKSFEAQIMITEGDYYVGTVDTGMYFNAGLAAINSGKYNEATRYFEKCAEMKYGGVKTYFQIYASYMGLGDTLKAESVLKNLTNIFPEDKNVTLQLIDHFIKNNNYNEALKYISIAKNENPDNYSIFFAAGIIYLNEFRYDEAIAELERSSELKPDLFDTQYGLGVAYVNKAAEMNTRANEIMDIDEYNRAVDQINVVYMKALPYMEKAHELNPDDEYAMRSLQELYYRLKQKDASLNQKYETIKAKLDSIENK